MNISSTNSACRWGFVVALLAAWLLACDEEKSSAKDVADDTSVDREIADSSGDGDEVRLDVESDAPEFELDGSMDSSPDATVDRLPLPHPFDLDSLDGENGVRIEGLGDCGTSVSGAGDINGDGYADILIGAHWANQGIENLAGETYVVFGDATIGSDGVLDLATLDGLSGFRVTGIDRFDESGNSVSGTGDVNGDGYSDILIGAYRAVVGENDKAGEVYLVFGGTTVGSSGLLDLASLDGTNGIRFEGIAADDLTGCSVSGAGDVDGDGYNDLLFGAYRASPLGEEHAGE